jgi:hypothetical protein
MEELNKQLGQLGGLGGILRGGAEVGKGPGTAMQEFTELSKRRQYLWDKQRMAAEGVTVHTLQGTVAVEPLTDAEKEELAGLPGEIAKKQSEMTPLTDTLRGTAPMTDTLRGLGAGTLRNPLTGLGEGTATMMDKAYTALDEGLTKMEQRVEASGDRIKTTFYDNLEEWLVRRLMHESLRS